MNDAFADAVSTGFPNRPTSLRLQRHVARLAVRCAMGSWLVLAAMPVIVLVCALS